MIALQLHSFGEVDVPALQYLSIVLPGHFGIPCHVHGQVLDPAHAYLHDRNQYHSTELLKTLQCRCEKLGKFCLALTDLDLCIPVLTFVFGEAVLDGDIALVSLHRLKQGFYGLPEDPDLLLRRTEKESLHELGHAAGLIHCRDYSCVMSFSNSVEQVDLKDAAYCQKCREVLDQHIRSAASP